MARRKYKYDPDERTMLYECEKRGLAEFFDGNRVSWSKSFKNEVVKNIESGLTRNQAIVQTLEDHGIETSVFSKTHLNNWACQSCNWKYLDETEEPSKEEDTKIANLEGCITILTQRITDDQQKIEELKSINTSLENRCERLVAENGNVLQTQSQLQEAQIECGRLRGKITSLNKTLEEVTKAKDEANNQCNRLRTVLLQHHIELPR